MIIEIDRLDFQRYAEECPPQSLRANLVLCDYLPNYVELRLSGWFVFHGRRVAVVRGQDIFLEDLAYLDAMRDLAKRYEEYNPNAKITIHVTKPTECE